MIVKSNNEATNYSYYRDLARNSTNAFAVNQFNEAQAFYPEELYDFDRNQNFTELNASEFEFEDSVSALFRNRNLEIKNATIGVNSAPILYDSLTNKPIAIFKPNNGVKSSVKWGDIIAYRLDHGSFAKVPYAFRFTHLPESFPERERFLSGSFVKWIPNAQVLTESEFLHSQGIQRQAIYILDFRLSNNDRHYQNMLKDKKGNFIPIDHDICFTFYPYLPACQDEPLYEECKDYILSLDINKDIEILREYEVPEIDIENFVIRTTLLKLAAEEPDITIGMLAHIMELTRLLPSNKLGRAATYFLSTNLMETFSLLYRGNPLNKILSNCTQPYNETELKAAFSESFQRYYSQARGVILTKEMTRSLIKMMYC